jgi:hypothetical protein
VTEGEKNRLQTILPFFAMSDELKKIITGFPPHQSPLVTASPQGEAFFRGSKGV